MIVQNRGLKLTEFEFKVGAVKELKAQLEVLSKKVDVAIKNVDQNGIDGNYSINSDILSVAQRVHSLSALLGYVKNFKLELSLPKEEGKGNKSNDKEG